MNTNNLHTMVDTILASPEEHGVQKLLDIAGVSTSNYDLVVKAVIHYTYLGNPDNYETLSKLILDLEELEDRNPRLMANGSIVLRLVGPLAGSRGKEINGTKLNRMQTDQHDLRALVVEELMLEIARKRSLKVVKSLLIAMDYPERWNLANELLETIMGNGRWKISYNSLEEFRRRIVPALVKWETREAAVKVIEKVIDDNLIPLIHLADPLLTTAQDEDASCKEECKKLLDKLLQKKLGGSTPPTTKRLISVITAILDDPERGPYAQRVAEKMIDEGCVPLIYLAGPLLAAIQDPLSRKLAMPLMNKIKKHLENGRKLGDEGDEISIRTKRIVSPACRNPSQFCLAVFLMKQMKKEGLWNLYDGPTWEGPTSEIARTMKGKAKIRSR